MTKRAKSDVPRKKINPFSSAEMKIIRSDLIHLWNQHGMRIFFILLPFIMAVVIPVAFFVVITLSDTGSVSAVPKALLVLLSDSAENLDYRQLMSHAFVSLICPIFYLCIPVISSVVAASSSFVTESENGTLETLMLSSVSPREIYNAKVAGSVILSVFVSLISFIAFAITASVGNVILWTPFFFSPSWLILLLGLMPALSVFCVLMVSLKLSKIHTVKESLKTMGYFILLIVVFYLLQMAGVYVITAQLLLILSLLLIILDIVLFNLSRRRFTPEEQLLKEFRFSQEEH